MGTHTAPAISAGWGLGTVWKAGAGHCGDRDKTPRLDPLCSFCPAVCASCENRETPVPLQCLLVPGTLGSCALTAAPKAMPHRTMLCASAQGLPSTAGAPPRPIAPHCCVF